MELPAAGAAGVDGSGRGRSRFEATAGPQGNAGESTASLKGDSYRLKDRNLGRIPAQATDE